MTKPQIKEYLDKIYNVRVTRVNTSNVLGIPSNHSLSLHRKWLSIHSLHYTETTRLEEGLCLHWSQLQALSHHHTRSQARVEECLIPLPLFPQHTISFVHNKHTHLLIPPSSHLVLTSRSLASLLEIVLEATGHRLQIAHATRSLTTTTRTLQSPVVYTHQHHTIPFYSVSSSHQGNRKNRSGSSECDKHDDRIFCKSCGSYRVSYQMKKYLSSTITVSTSTTLDTPFLPSPFPFHSSSLPSFIHLLTIRF